MKLTLEYTAKMRLMLSGLHNTHYRNITYVWVKIILRLDWKVESWETRTQNTAAFSQMNPIKTCMQWAIKMHIMTKIAVSN